MFTNKDLKDIREQVSAVNEATNIPIKNTIKELARGNTFIAEAINQLVNQNDAIIKTMELMNEKLNNYNKKLKLTNEKIDILARLIQEIVSKSSDLLESQCKFENDYRKPLHDFLLDFMNSHLSNENSESINKSSQGID